MEVYIRINALKSFEFGRVIPDFIIIIIMKSLHPTRRVLSAFELQL